ncbi:MAG: DUF4838 domain-containing protein [Planctomycetaceae bacterium]
MGRMRFSWWLPVLCMMGAFLSAEEKRVTVQVARDGKALLPVLIPAEAGERVEAAAKKLQTHLQQITGAEFKLSREVNQPGILVCPIEFVQFPFVENNLEFEVPWNEREDYGLETSKNRIWLIGQTEESVEYAVWDLLHQIGYRQYFPGKNWEFIPKIPDLELTLARRESPDYHSRLIWYGYGAWDHGEAALIDWQKKNRIGAAIKLNTGHAYGRIIKAKQAEFEAHPEYRALIDGKRNLSPTAKFCISNPGLRNLVVEYAHEYFEENPEADSVSMDPSDGGGWCECDECQQMGSMSDRALTLANEVARAINGEGKPDRFVGMYAYNYHSPPPTIEVDPHVIISVATSFIRGGYTLDELLKGWAAKGAKLGIRDYYSVSTWDRDMPGKTRASNLEWLQKQIPLYHELGAQFSTAESGESWGTTGLGHYFASRVLWDVNEADRLDEIRDEFLSNCFGSARETMRLFYEQLDGSRSHLMREDQIARMYRLLKQARVESEDQQVQARLKDLLLYTRYVDLYYQYESAKGKARQAAFEKMIRHAYRARNTYMMHVLALYRDIDKRDRGVEIPEEAAWNVPEEQNPWKTSEPFSDVELEQFLSEGMERYQPVELGFEPVTYSQELVSAAPLELQSGETLTTRWSFRGKFHFFTYAERPQTEIEMGITGGLIEHYRDRGNVKIELWKIGGSSETGEQETLVTGDRSVPPDGETRVVKMTATEPGLYVVRLSDGGDMTRIDWRSELPFTIEASLENPPEYKLRMNHYFYVPKGTKVIGLQGGGTGRILDPLGQEVLLLEKQKPGFYSIPVPKGRDGKLWQIIAANQEFRLMTVPPYLSGSSRQLLLPREVLDRDR